MSALIRPSNFRDVGEMLGLWLDVSPVPRGRLLRGGRVDHMASSADLGFPGTILNLRRGPDPEHLAGVVRVQVPATDDLENYDTHQRRVRQWVGAALSALIGPAVKWPVYVHCTSGRDRTGVVVAAALLLVGVPREVVAEEYMLSDGATRSSIELAIDGILDAQATLEVYRPGVRTALLACGAPHGDV
jgi:protein-tyrosine phosphatase